MKCARVKCTKGASTRERTLNRENVQESEHQGRKFPRKSKFGCVFKPHKCSGHDMYPRSNHRTNEEPSQVPAVTATKAPSSRKCTQYRYSPQDIFKNEDMDKYKNTKKKHPTFARPIAHRRPHVNPQSYRIKSPSHLEKASHPSIPRNRGVPRPSD